MVLGFTSDGCEVAVLILDKSQAYIDPYLLDIMCDPELDHHFILKCKVSSVSGMFSTRGRWVSELALTAVCCPHCFTRERFCIL